MYAVEGIESASSRAKMSSVASVSEAAAKPDDDLDEGRI